MNDNFFLLYQSSVYIWNTGCRSMMTIYSNHQMASQNECSLVNILYYTWSKLNTGRIDHTVAFRDTERVFTGTLQLHGLASQTDVEFTTFYRVSIKLFIIWRNTMAHFWNGRKAHQEKGWLVQVTYCYLAEICYSRQCKVMSQATINKPKSQCVSGCWLYCYDVVKIKD